MNALTTSGLLKNVWGMEPEGVAPLIAAVEAKNTAAIETCIVQLEQLLAKTSADSFRDDMKYRAWLLEVEAKIAVLRAELAKTPEAWLAAAKKYDDMAAALSALQRSCDSGEDIAALMFQANVESTTSLAAGCRVMAQGNTPEARKAIDINEAKAFIDRIGPHIDRRYDYTHSPKFASGCHNVCALTRTAENGSTYGYDTVYLVWRGNDGELHYKEIANSRATKDYLHVDKVTLDGNSVTVKYGSGGSYSGKPWDNQVSAAVV